MNAPTKTIDAFAVLEVLGVAENRDSDEHFHHTGPFSPSRGISADTWVFSSYSVTLMCYGTGTGVFNRVCVYSKDGALKPFWDDDAVEFGGPYSLDPSLTVDIVGGIRPRSLQRLCHMLRADEFVQAASN